MVTIIHQHYPSIGSTQTLAKKKCAVVTSPDHWLIVTADEQTEGRGTQGRVWDSPANQNLYTTLVIPFPKREASMLPHLSCLSLVMAVAVAQVLEQEGLRPAIKWPNDLLLNDKKVCGILCEQQPLAGVPGQMALLVGIGLNVHGSQAWCAQIDQPVTSLCLETKKRADLDLGTLLKKLVDRSYAGIERLKAGGFGLFLGEIADRLAWRGKRVLIRQDDKWIGQGTLVGIHTTGELLLETEGGHITVIAAGKIERTTLC